MDMLELLDYPPRPHDRVETLYVWVSIHPNGGEVMISADFAMTTDGTIRHMPLMTSNKLLAHGNMRDLARRIQRLSTAEGKPIEIQLRTFRVVQP